MILSRSTFQAALKALVALINPQMPRVHGDGIIHFSHFDAVVHHDGPLWIHKTKDGFGGFRFRMPVTTRIFGCLGRKRIPKKNLDFFPWFATVAGWGVWEYTGILICFFLMKSMECIKSSI